MPLSHCSPPFHLVSTNHTTYVSRCLSSLPSSRSSTHISCHCSSPYAGGGRHGGLRVPPDQGRPPAGLPHGGARGPHLADDGRREGIWECRQTCVHACSFLSPASQLFSLPHAYTPSHPLFSLPDTSTQHTNLSHSSLSPAPHQTPPKHRGTRPASSRSSHGWCASSSPSLPGCAL